MPLGCTTFVLISTPAQEELIKELTTQVSRLTPMMKENRTSTSLFLTREGVDEDKRIFEERLKELQGQLTQKDGVIRDKDTRIAALNEQRSSRRSHLFCHRLTIQLQWRRHKQT